MRKDLSPPDFQSEPHLVISDTEGGLSLTFCGANCFRF